MTPTAKPPVEDSPDPATPAPPTPATPRVSIGQAVVDHPQVVSFLHLDIPAHVPLRVYAVPELRPEVASIRAAGKPAVLVDKPDDARVRLTKVSALADSSQRRVFIEIPAEGARGHVDVELRDNTWQAIDAELVEN